MKQKENTWIDVHNDELMVSLGFRHPNIIIRDKDVWTKTYSEKRILRNLRKSYKGKMYSNSSFYRYTPIRCRLIVQLKKNKKFKNSTYSSICNISEIDNVLSKYYLENNRCLIVKYFYNGKCYKPEERPFWPSLRIR